MKAKKKYFCEKEMARLISAMHRAFADKLNHLLLDGTLNISDVVTLEILFQEKSSNMSELSNALKLTMSAATAIIDKLIGLKLVSRHHSESDRRIVEVSLTKKGKVFAARLNKNRLALVKDVFSVFSQKEKRLYLELIRKLYKGLKDKR